MNFPDGTMSTRKGKVVLLDDVLDEAVKRAAKVIEEHQSTLPEKEQKELARVVGIGAVKYNILSQNRMKNYTFVWDTMLSFEGNSAPYLQYAYTRTQSILSKTKDVKISDHIKIEASEEKKLLKKMLQFPEILEQISTEYKPSLLCTYLFELAQTFNHLYNNLRIIDAEKPENRDTRIKLVKAVGYLLSTGLSLLGIEVPERM